MKHIVLAGLGNPGSAYNKTRHNIGFDVVDSISEENNFPQFSSKFSALISSKIMGIYKITLVKPQTFMNLSGQSLSKILHFYKLKSDDLIVIHDDLDLAFAKVKMKIGGGAGGHNGLKSTDQHLGQDYYRLRIGIGKPVNRQDVSNYVLERFPSIEEEIMQNVIKNITSNLNLLLAKDMAMFMNKMAMEYQKYGI